MRILFDGRVITDHFPGIGRYAYHLAGALADRAEVEITLLVDSLSPRRRYDLDALALTHPRIKLLPVPVPTFSRKEQTLLPRFIRSIDHEVYHALHYARPYFGLRKPVVLTLHDLIPLILPQYWSTKNRVIYRWLNRLAVRTATKIITPSTATRNDLIRLFGVKFDRVQVIPEAVDNRFKPASVDQVAAIRSKYQLPAHYLLYVGINKPPKNLLRLNEAYARLIEPIPQYEYDCIIAGAWDDRYPQVKQRTIELGLARRVHFIGSISDGDLPALYSSADVFVTPSLYEGFGLPVLEAMACGTPVISSQAASLPEVVDDAGVLFDPMSVEAIASAIQHVTTNTNLRLVLQQRGLERVKRFTWDRAAEETINVYQAVMGW